MDCHIGGHFVGALAYADDVTLVAPSRSVIRTLIVVFRVGLARGGGGEFPPRPLA